MTHIIAAIRTLATAGDAGPDDCKKEADGAGRRDTRIDDVAASDKPRGRAIFRAGARSRPSRGAILGDDYWGQL